MFHHRDLRKFPTSVLDLRVLTENFQPVLFHHRDLTENFNQCPRSQSSYWNFQPVLFHHRDLRKFSTSVLDLRVLTENFNQSCSTIEISLKISTSPVPPSRSEKNFNQSCSTIEIWERFQPVLFHHRDLTENSNQRPRSQSSHWKFQPGNPTTEILLKNFDQPCPTIEIWGKFWSTLFHHRDLTEKFSTDCSSTPNLHGNFSGSQWWNYGWSRFFRRESSDVRTLEKTFS